MKLPRRRQFLQLAAGAAALPVVSRFAMAQAYPSRPVRIVVGFPPGGTADITTRLIGQWLSERLGQPFVIENRPGAATNLATEAVVRAPADGHTLLFVGASNAINATLYEKLSFNFIRDIVIVGGLTRTPLVLEVHPAMQATSVPELISYAKANPGKISLASYGVGTISHLAGELFKMANRIDAVHVPYRGSNPMLPDLLGGQVQAAFDNLPTSIEHIKTGKLRALAVTTPIRSDALPQVPALSEFVPNYEATAFGAIGAPKNTPVEIVRKLNAEINAGLSDSKIKTRLADLGAAPFAGSPAEVGSYFAAETDKWGAVVKAGGLKPE